MIVSQEILPYYDITSELTKFGNEPFFHIFLIFLHGSHHSAPNLIIKNPGLFFRK